MVFNQQYSKAVIIVPSATVNFKKQGTVDDLTSAIYVGGAGIVDVVFQDDTVVSFTCVAGQILPVKAKRVNATSTATLMVALYAL